MDIELMRVEASEDAERDVYAAEVVQLCDLTDRLKARAAALENALRACCEAVETEKTCRECGGVQSFTDGDEDGVIARHRDDCEFGAARALLDGASAGRLAELESLLEYHRKTVCSCDDGHVCRVCQLLDGERP